MKLTFFHTLLLQLMFVGFAMAQTAEWKLAKSGDGIEIYTRTRDGGKVKEYKAITTVNQKLTRVEQLLDDIDRYPDWQSNLESSEIIERIDDQTIIGRYLSSTPWPFDDRDIVLKMRKEKNGSELVYRIENAPDAYPEDEDYVRIPTAGGYWQVTEVDGNKCELVYQFYADPGGSIPKWLVNMFIVQGPYNSFTRMKEVLN